MTRRSLSVLSAAGLVLAACSSSASGPGSSTPGTTSFSFATGTAGSAKVSASTMAGSSVSQIVKVATTTDSIEIDSAFVVLRKIELQGVDSTSKGGCPDEGMPSATAACAEVKLGPVLVSLPLNDTTGVQTFATKIPNGTYGRIEFRIHLPRAATDTAFVAANPGYDSTSVRVVGKFNNKPFVFTSAVSAHYEADLVPPVVVTDTTAHNLTFKVDVGTWFKTAAGALIDPATAAKGTANGMVVGYNIRKSFRALEDDGHHGQDDHGQSGQGRDRDGN